MERLPEIGEAIRYNDLYVCRDGAHSEAMHGYFLRQQEKFYGVELDRQLVMLP
jgi:hypothetical protein